MLPLDYTCIYQYQLNMSIAMCSHSHTLITTHSTHYSLYSLLTLLTTHYSLLTTHYSLGRAHRRPDSSVRCTHLTYRATLYYLLSLPLSLSLSRCHFYTHTPRILIRRLFGCLVAWLLGYWVTGLLVCPPFTACGPSTSVAAILNPTLTLILSDSAPVSRTY